MTNTESTAGISSLGLALPSLAMDVERLAALRGVDPDKYTKGLGCRQMALCAEDEGVVSLATKAARRALARWDGDLERIGLVAVGTETAVDMSRPLSQWVGSELGLEGSFRSYEVKHACYGGTLALRQALEWRLSGAARDPRTGRSKAALVIAADVALYAQQDGGEPTQGAGAVAMIVDDGRIATIDPVSHAFSAPAFDFWRPVGHDFPRVDGPLSLECYMRAAEHCFGELAQDEDPAEAIDRFAALCFHVPFPKMVKKAIARIGDALGWDEQRVASVFETKVDPTMEPNRQVGNAYTASLWLSVAGALAGRAQGERIAAFSYGSGFGAELLTLTAGPEAADARWSRDLEQDLADRRSIDADEYVRLRQTASKAA